jgi:hypothetical protein
MRRGADSRSVDPRGMEDMAEKLKETVDLLGKGGQVKSRWGSRAR